jgi:hypothetical protein
MKKKKAKREINDELRKRKKEGEEDNGINGTFWRRTKRREIIMHGIEIEKTMRLTQLH